jgi:(1->4)-alpha-D-glucan 1-alpha-D-glucosylmutase
LKTALRHFLASLSVYRTYRMPGGEISPEDKARVLRAVEEGIRRNPCVDPVPVRFVGRVITGDYPSPEESPERKEKFARWVAKLQQVTGAIMAKSVEDTHFYRYVRMFAANEVGSHPSRFGQPVAAFNEANRQRQKNWPYCMLTTSTHDTKMSEDARARLFALAEWPAEWAENLKQWHALNAEAKSEVEGRPAPDRREEYLLYQALLASWPLGMTGPDAEFLERIKSYFRKAQGEAKLNTAWTFPHAKWHEAGERFVEAILGSAPFLKSFLPFAERVAEKGMIFSLAQTVLKLTAPGIPDIYQGNEIWDFSLVDPDNRRPVDYARRVELLASIDKRRPSELLEHWQDGGIKMKVTQALLQFRRQHPEVFSGGDYLPLETTGEKAEDIVAFLRKSGETEVLVVVPIRASSTPEAGRSSEWKDTAVRLPQARTWESVLTGGSVAARGDCILASSLFSELPVAAFVSR